MIKSKLILRQIQLNTNSIYLEFGAGSSTITPATTPSIEHIVSIESDFRFWTKLYNSNSEFDLAVKRKYTIPLLL
jgi:16S rRNA A1518/A1519 N6-dimethyltransferase RsmA/KsgA/DIM1 with predicted DNA glycosylase/AP lyase activity